MSDAKDRLIRIMGTFDLATGHADTMDQVLDALEDELSDVIGHLRARREWVGLTDEEINCFAQDLYGSHNYWHVAANLVKAEFLSEDEQVSYTGNGTAGRENMTAPTGFLFQLPKREWVGLTDEGIWQTVNDCTFADDLHADKFARAIEAKLREKNT